MSDQLFTTATPKAEKVAKAERQPPAQDVVAGQDVVKAPRVRKIRTVQGSTIAGVAIEAPVKKTRKKRVSRDATGEHMLFMKLYNELNELPKAARSRLLEALSEQLT